MRSLDCPYCSTHAQVTLRRAADRHRLRNDERGEMNTEPDEMVIELLGPLSVHLNRTPVLPSPAKPRQILALVALNAGRVVTVSTLAEEIWGDYPPRSAATTLQTYILQIRNLIAAAVAPGADPKQVLSTRHCGYLLGSHTSQNDVHEFGRLSRAGRVAAETGAYRAGSDLLGRALALWGGTGSRTEPGLSGGPGGGGWRGGTRSGREAPLSREAA